MLRDWISKLTSPTKDAVEDSFESIVLNSDSRKVRCLNGTNNARHSMSELRFAQVEPQKDEVRDRKLMPLAELAKIYETSRYPKPLSKSSSGTIKKRTLHNESMAIAPESDLPPLIRRLRQRYDQLKRERLSRSQTIFIPRYGIEFIMQPFLQRRLLIVCTAIRPQETRRTQQSLATECRSFTVKFIVGLTCSGELRLSRMFSLFHIFSST